MISQDKKLLDTVKEYINEQVPHYIEEVSGSDRVIEHPLDADVVAKLEKLVLQNDDDDFRIFIYINEIKELWSLIIEKSIKCLRYFDSREPFLENESKHPVAYGVRELKDYFEKYTQFETMLYGGGKYYRDHVVHVFRVWLLGLECLLEDNGEYLKRINIQKGVQTNSLEKISIWSMIALTHDLGYPLEKAQEILEKTKDMMRSFVSNPTLSMDLSFNGIQNNMNDFVVRFLSSKMHLVKKDNESGEDKTYVARLQPKYYFKFQKSLEGYNHGILSSIIIYKLLLYFLESDFSINEDYRFDEEEARQFYIRREILRTIASHTCKDVYHLDMLNFAFLLIMVDDAQEWGRKRISELYNKKKSEYEFESITPKFETKTTIPNGEKIHVHSFVAKEQFTFSKEDVSSLKEILSRLMGQCKGYEQIFRDGQDTARRNFVFEKDIKVKLEESKPVIFDVKFIISNDERQKFEIAVTAETQKAKKEYDISFLKSIFSKYEVEEIQNDITSKTSDVKRYEVKD